MMTLHDLTVPQLVKMLANLDNWLGAGVAYADTKKFDANTLLKARLAPDAYSLDRQVQSCCDNAKFIVARLAGKDWPKHEDNETTIDQLRQRIAQVTAYVHDFKPEDFAEASTRHITLPWMPNKWMSGDEYVREFALPNLYFHMTMAYAILRHNGVPLGKAMFIGSVPMHG